MLVVIQRVSQAQVKVKNKVISRIGSGFVILLGVIQGDQDKDLEYLVRKISKLRIMSDQDQKMNLSLHDAGGEILLVSQFTLAADVSKGNRPSFIKAADPQLAEKYYHQLTDQLKATGLKVTTGQFGRYMKVKLVNDGPVTIIINSQDKL